MSDDAPEGYRWEWVPEEYWKVPADGRKCSSAGCLNAAIALLRRTHGRFPSGFAWWGYCAKHLYGLGTIRKIEDGVVKVRRAVKSDHEQSPCVGQAPIPSGQISKKEGRE